MTEERHRGLRVLRCWSSSPTDHAGHTHQIKDERYWCPGYANPRYSPGQPETFCAGCGESGAHQ